MKIDKEEKQKQIYKKYLDKYGGVRMYPDGRLEPIIKEKKLGGERHG